MIREIQQKDKDMFLSMVNEFYHSEAVLHDIPVSNIMNTYQELLTDSPYAKAFIIEEDNDIAGYALLSLTYSNEAGGLVVLVEELFIREKFRGRGLGNKMLDFIYSEYENKAKRFRLEIVKSNKDAEKLYLKKGFVHLDYLQMIHDKN